MATNLRTLGVKGKNLPAKKSLSVVPSDFRIGGMLIECERMFAVPFKVSAPEEFAIIFGNPVSETQYGNDAVKGFFDNVAGVDASLYIQSMPGYDTAGDVIDAVIASRDKADEGSDADAYLIESAYEDEPQYGASGNRIGTLITQVDRFATEGSAICPATGQSYAELDSVVGIKVGDLILFKTNAGVDLVYKIVTQVDESTKRVYWTGDFEVSGGSAEALAVDDEVVIPGFTVQTYYKSINGVETEVDSELGNVICSSESAVTDFYVGNVFQSSKYIRVTESSVSSLGDRLPVDDTAITYPTNGTDGTAVATVEAQAFYLSKFDSLPVRLVANPETTNEDMQKAIIEYNASRLDTPIAIINIAENRTESQLITIGQNFLTTNFAPNVIVANWLKVDDPFTSSAISPYRNVPNVGHVMGAWIWSIANLGVHYIPCTSAVTLKGIRGVVGEQFKDNRKRTSLAEKGINVIQEISGSGTRVMNLFTSSTADEYQFACGILMRNYVKVSAQDSLQESENTPNSINRVQADKMAIVGFLYNLWYKGSTGSVPVGETFGQSRDDNNNPTVPEDHFEVVADVTNNPQNKLNIGERNVYAHFTFPAPGGSIDIGVGILLRG